MHVRIANICWLLVLNSAALHGCGETKDPHGRQAVSGTVTFQGKPLDHGRIQFLPPDNTGLNAGALIRDGKYQIPREQGLVPGTYRVEINAPEQGAPPPGPPGADVVEPARERIPPEFHRDSQRTIEVKADQANKFDFTIP